MSIARPIHEIACAIFSKAASENPFIAGMIYCIDSNNNRIIFIWWAIAGEEASREKKKEEGLRHAWSRPAYHTSKDQNCFSLPHFAYDRRINYLPTCRRERSKMIDTIIQRCVRHNDSHTVAGTLRVCYATRSRTY